MTYLSISAINFSPPTSDFELPVGLSFPLLLTSGGSRDLEITFSRATPGTSSCTISIFSNDTDENPYTFNIEGTASSNSPPEIDLNGTAGGYDFAATFNEDEGPVAIVSPAMTVTDDDTHLVSATVTIDNQQDGDVLAADNTDTSISVVYNSGVLTLSNSDTVANYQKVLRTVTYNNTQTPLDTTTRNITFVVNDGTSDSDTATSTVTIVENAVPTLDINGSATGNDYTAAIFAAGDGAISIVDAGLTLADSDDANLDSATVTITNLQDGTDETLSATAGSTGIGVSYDSATGKLTLSGSSSTANYQQVLRTMKYDNSAAAPNTTARDITFVVNDGSEDSSSATSTVTICLNSATVTINGNSGPGTLRQAVTDICSGGTISFDNDHTINLSGKLVIDKDLIIDGSGYRISVNGQSPDRVFQINSGVTALINNMTITGGNSGNPGGGINNMGNLTVSNCTLSGNRTSMTGGAIHNNLSAVLLVYNSTLSGNTAGLSGGGISNFGTVIVSNCTLLWKYGE